LAIKVRVLEKDFPAGIPNDIGHDPLEVINEDGEIIALFWDTSFVLRKFTDSLEYIKHYDNIFDHWKIWDWSDLLEAGNLDDVHGEEKSELSDERDEEMELGPNYRWDNFNWSNRRLIALTRLAYPYHLRGCDKVLKCYKHASKFSSWDESSVQQWVLAYGDPGLISKYLRTPYFGSGHQHEYKYFVYRFFYSVFGDSHTPHISDLWISKNNYSDRVYEYPEVFLTTETIDILIDVAEQFEDLEMLAFLQDYKNNHFPPVGGPLMDPEPNLEKQIQDQIVERLDTRTTSNIALSRFGFLNITNPLVTFGQRGIVYWKN